MSTLETQIALAKYWLENSQINTAKAILIQIHELHPRNTESTELLAQIFSHEGNIQRAIELQKELVSDPNCNFATLFNLGDFYLEGGNPTAAIEAYQASLKKNGPFFEGCHNLGLAYSQIFQYKEASKHFAEACTIDPHSFEAQLNFGACLKNLGNLQQSLEHIIAAEKIYPSDSRVWLNKGVTLEAMNRPQEALASFEKALSLNPDYLEAHTNKANVLIVLGRHGEAKASFEAALQIDSNDADTRYNLAYLQLAEGNNSDGWLNYEYRWLRQNAPKKLLPQVADLSNLNNLHGKKILVWSEQGLGDSIQFCRYVPKLSELGAHVTIATHPQLIDLFKTLSGGVKLTLLSDIQPPNYDAQISMMSLPFLFSQVGLNDIPNGPYLKSCPNKSLDWKSRIQEEKLKVGLVWNAGWRADQPELFALNERRNIPLSLISKLQNIPGVQFFSLQKGDPAESELLREKEKIWPKSNLSIFTNELHSFEDTAALVENLDLIISADTSTAHLAGALGKPAWILNRFDSCWRWPREENMSLWYPSAIVFNQKIAGDWDPVIAKVESKLKTMAQPYL